MKGLYISGTVLIRFFYYSKLWKKTSEKQIDIHNFLVAYKASFDSTMIIHLYETMSNFGTSVKLIGLCKMTLYNYS